MYKVEIIAIFIELLRRLNGTIYIKRFFQGHMVNAQKMVTIIALVELLLSFQISASIIWIKYLDGKMQILFLI